MTVDGCNAQKGIGNGAVWFSQEDIQLRAAHGTLKQRSIADTELLDLRKQGIVGRRPSLQTAPGPVGQGLLLLPADTAASGHCADDFLLDDDVSQALINQLGRLNLLHTLHSPGTSSSCSTASNDWAPWLSGGGSQPGSAASNPGGQFDSIPAALTSIISMAPLGETSCECASQQGAAASSSACQSPTIRTCRTSSLPHKIFDTELLLSQREGETECRPASSVPRFSVLPLPPLATPVVSVPLPLIEEAERLLESASHSWRFDAFQLHEATLGHSLSCLAFFLFHQARLFCHFPLHAAKLARFLRRLEEGYHDNPYHNSVHAADVLQSVHVILTRGGFTQHYADPLSLMACLIAASVHDFEHVGLTNAFLVASQHPLAIRYNDRSPQENHHLAAAFSLLLQPQYNFLEQLPQTSVFKLRQMVMELVLGTDMQQHIPITQRFIAAHSVPPPGADLPPVFRSASSRASSFKTPSSSSSSLLAGLVAPVSPALSSSASTRTSVSDCDGQACVPASRNKAPSSEGERMLALQVALKAADLGHLAAETSVHTRWVSRLEAEFFDQGDCEKAAGLPISPLFDRTKKGVTKSQVGFFDFAVIPLFHALAHVFPHTRDLFTHVLQNYKYWLDKGMAEKLLYKPKHQEWVLRHLLDCSRGSGKALRSQLHDA